MVPIYNRHLGIQIFGDYLNTEVKLCSRQSKDVTSMIPTLLLYSMIIVTISAKTHLVRTTSEFLFQCYFSVICIVQGIFQSIMVSSFGITVLESRESKEIDLSSDCTKNKLQALTFAAIASVWISLQR